MSSPRTPDHDSQPRQTADHVPVGDFVAKPPLTEERRQRPDLKPTHLRQHSASQLGQAQSYSNYLNPPPSASPHRTAFQTPQGPHSASPLRSNFTFGHSPRSASVSMSQSFSSPSSLQVSNGDVLQSSLSPSSIPSQVYQAQQRHSRIHSRNLSLYFPRPGATGAQHTAIAEDGSQEIEAPETITPAANGILSAPPAKLGEGFTFGKPGTMPLASPISPGGGLSTRKGHHHKHSLSHNFFSFMDPTAVALVPPQTPGASSTATIPPSPWAPISPFPITTPTHLQPAANITSAAGSLPSPSTQTSSSLLSSLLALPASMKHALLFSLTEFLIGAFVWAEGQQNGTIGCTGLGYWVVFDAVGVSLTVFGKLLRFGERSSIRKPYGSQRIETVSLFAQSIYLLFSAVYVCKETIEHVLLSAGSGHHHHRTDEYEQNLIGVAFPTILIWLSVFSLVVSSLVYRNHYKLVDATGNHIPSLSSILHPSEHSSSRSSQLTLFSNPFTVAPLIFSTFLLCASYFVPKDHQRYADLVLAGIETLITFSVAYPAAVALGKVLSQTAPPRGLPGAQMESFLRVMRELERHPHVLHLPAPHIWQLTPPSQSRIPSRKDKEGSELDGSSLVVTLELHVKKDLPDSDVLQLTRWAWERCSTALGQGGEAVTVGIVRG